MTQPVVFWIVTALSLGSLGFLAFLGYAAVRYAPIIGRIFEEKPLFLPLRLPPAPGAEEVRFSASDGVKLAGSYHAATTTTRVGVLVFCHEYLSDRHSFQPYVGPLRDRGFDIFSFDFRSHGGSEAEPNYQPLQWVTDHEVRDLKAALEYLRSRPDADPAGYGLFGVSRGGGISLAVAAEDPSVWGIVTDGAFPTRGTMLAYILRWAEIYVSNKYFWKAMPLWVFRFVASAGRVRSEKRLNCRYPDLEKAVSRLAPRPWFMIHGAKDAYIPVGIAETFFARGREPKELWIVPKAKHNRCRDVAGEEYQTRVETFFARWSPRRLAEPAKPEPTSADNPANDGRASASSGELTGCSINDPLPTTVSG